ARRYSAYFRDVCSLDLGNLACTRVSGWRRQEDDDSNRRLYPYDFLFAISTASGKVYWSTLELRGAAAPTGYEHSFWRELSALTGNVTGLVGAAPYTPRRPTPYATPSGWVYLFVLTRDLERTSLVYIRYNLVTRQWDAPQDLPGPKSGTFTASLQAGNPF